MNTEKLQEDDTRTPADAPPGAVISPDTLRPQRIPPGQSRTKKWPVLDAGGTPRIDIERWKLSVFGLVNHPVEWSWREFNELPRVHVFSDFHCVTRWSRLGNVWEGVATREILARAGGPLPEARFVLAHGYDSEFTTNVPLQDFLAEDSLVAIRHDGEPLSLDHGGPARLIVPRLYAWKSAKWVRRIELLARTRQASGRAMAITCAETRGKGSAMARFSRRALLGGALASACTRKRASRYQGWLFVASGAEKAVAVANLASFQRTLTIPLPHAPEQLLHSENRVFATCPEGRALVEIDAVALRLSGRIALPGRPVAARLSRFARRPPVGDRADR